MSFTADGVGFAYGLRSVSFTLPEKGLVTLAGPNGAGKSTLLSLLAGVRSPYRGSLKYAGREVHEWPQAEFALQVAYVPQAVRVDFPFTAGEIVLMGRTPRTGGWSESARDHEAAEHAMTITDCLALRHRDFRELSGGERQRVVLASALAQEPRALVLDEPATHLDLRHQLALYKLLAKLGESMLVIAATHDLNLALRFAERVLILEAGSLAGDGAPVEVLHPGTIEAVFGVRATVHITPQGKPWMIPADGV